MTNGVKETTCTRCVHRGICKHQDNFLKVINAVNHANVVEEENEQGLYSSKCVTNFECVKSIEVICEFYQKEQPQNREGIF